MVLTHGAHTDQLRASRQLAVAVKPSGIVLPGYDDRPEIALGLPELELVERLADPARTVSLARVDTAAAALLDQLAERGLVTESASLDVTSEDHEPAAPAGDTASTVQQVVLPTPVLVGVGPSGFELRDHEGRLRAALSARDLVAITALRLPATLDEAFARQAEELGAEAMARDAFVALVRGLEAADLIVPYDAENPAHARKARQAEIMRDRMRREAAVHDAFDRIEAERGPRADGDRRVPVIGFHRGWSIVPASLGMIVAAAKAHDGGALERHYDFHPRLHWDRARLEAVAGDRPGIFLFSNYVWSSPQNLATSALVKQLDPDSITIHGGPDTPKYHGDSERFFAEHPHVDITVHGEGEATFPHLLEALAGHAGDGPPDLEPLRDVPGLSFRSGDGVVHTEPRDRIADLDTIPSPVLTGLYEGFIPAGGGPAGLTLETNRGCPYGCTFCDWGSATLSRIRKFDLDRVFAELEWCAEHGFKVAIADANYGILERDVAIAEKIAELKAEHGYPQFVGTNYAKNTTKHLAKIIDVFTDAGIVAEGKLSMQTFDQGTLTTIRRKNIKVEKYHDLSVEFRRNELPLSVDIMMGLPGSTPEAFRRDLQSCIDRDLRAVIHPTMLLPNSPMNDPEYRAENGIVARPGEIVRQTNTFTEDEWNQMQRARLGFWMFENFAVLRQVATYVRSETSEREIDFYQRLVDDVDESPESWPLTALVVRVLPPLMVPPVSWGAFRLEIHRYLVDRIGLRDDDALATVLDVQHALLPSRDRAFPVMLDLAHDYVGWRNDVVARREAGELDDWHLHVAPLRERAPGRLHIEDPLDSCQTALGKDYTLLSEDSAWDLDSPVSRPRQAEAKTFQLAGV